MKADLTKPEVREAFRAQYLHQAVFVSDYQLGYLPLECSLLMWKNPLHLRHISSLTEEEKRQLVKDVAFRKDFYSIYTYGDGKLEICYHTGHDPEGNMICRYEYIYINHPEMLSSVADWLRRKGFLVDYAGNSCEELISAGLSVYRKEETK